jgi:serine/threonine-protein kinase
VGVATDITLPERYRLLGHIASGGMAAVYSAEDRLLERRVAVKVLAAHLAAEPGAQQRFAREARAAARVSDHPHVVTIYDVGEHDGRAFMVMELMAGGTLADRLRDGRPAREDAVRWLGEAAAALDTAHREEIVHRDVKPANLLLDGRDRLAVGDFGIARLAADAAMTQTGMVLGTAAYIAPEQAMGHEATRASDRYALAVVAYELLTGERPFRSGTAASQARQHVDEEPPRASQEAPDLPPALDDVLARGMAKAPEGRPASAQELADEIRDALASAPDPTATTRRGMGAAAGAGAAAGGAAAAGAAAGAGTRRREPIVARQPTAARGPGSPPGGQVAAPDRRLSRRFPLIIAALLAVGLLSALAVATFGGGDEQAATTQAEPPEEPEAQEPEAEPDPAPAEPEPEAQEPDLSGADPVALNGEGYDLFLADSYDEAIPLLERSVAAFEAQERTGETEYPFALYNLGASLNRAGRPQEAIPFLERRLEVSPDDRPGIIEAELADARGGDASARGGRGGKDKDEDEDDD